MEPEEFHRLAALEETHWWFAGMRSVSWALLERFAPAAAPLRVLDAGCGTGGMLRRLEALGPAVGVDLSPLALALARERGAAPLVRASLEALPFVDESFDLVTSLDVLYHRAVGDDVAALRELRRVLRPGGLLLVRVPAHDRLRSAHDRAVHARQRYGKAELEAKIADAGLAPLFLSYANCLLFPLALVLRWVSRRRPAPAGSDVRPVAPSLNAALDRILRLEARWLRHGPLPFGLSLVAVARREPGGETGPRDEKTAPAP